MGKIPRSNSQNEGGWHISNSYSPRDGCCMRSRRVRKVHVTLPFVFGFIRTTRLSQNNICVIRFTILVSQDESFFYQLCCHGFFKGFNFIDWPRQSISCFLIGRITSKFWVNFKSKQGNKLG